VRRVLVTHVDSTVGRRLLKALYRDPEVGLILGVDTGPSPSFLEPYRTKCVYQRLDLAKARHLLSFFQSERFARARLDSVIHLPFVQERPGERVPGNVHLLVSETRRLLLHVKREKQIQRFIYLSTGFVYRPEPGNVNIVNEEQFLDFEGGGDTEIRGWIDSDLVSQAELHNPHLKVTILRAATVITESGEFLLSPPLERGEPPLGFDPMVSVVADRDVALALGLAMHADRPGIYNIAGREVFPRSALVGAAARTGSLFLPSLLRESVAWLGQAVAAFRSSNVDFTRYGIVLDTRRAAEALGFEPHYRIEIRGAGFGRRIETIRVR
jgi:nucleoside-diphosphate-sugar epimerase